MRIRALLHSTDLPSSPPPPAAISIDSDMVVILASLLCALICVAGLALVARCACRRRPRRADASTTSAPAVSAPCAPKGLKKKAIDALPTVSYAAGDKQQAAECIICLAEFAAGEELRVLPHCGHGFHMACIDTWLGAHATCPSCRATVGTPPPALFLPGRCRRCGEVGDVATLGAAAHFSGTSALASNGDVDDETPPHT
uniref:RING-type E3 ubiquitin transferase n=1 Tax=Leersia perrieri TaxID=77586 RepID=A0A0D9VN43_9ORYZ